MPDLETKIRLEFLREGVRSAKDLAARLRVSQPTVSRALATLSHSLIRLGRGPSTRYGLRQEIADLGAHWPLYLINEAGTPEQIGELHALAGPAYWLESSGRWDTLLSGDFADGIFRGIPWFLDDTRPQGFLGRTFARRHGRDLGQSGGNPSLWPGPVVLEALLRYGHDLPGAFVLGTDALADALGGRDAMTVATSERTILYPDLADAAMAGMTIGSSAGGEQPKFLVTTADRSVLVKFSHDRTTEAGQRWADLLYAEKIAAEILGENGHAVPALEILDAGHRRFLEVTRFDRVGARGRVPVVSLRSLDAAHFGYLDTPWTAAASRLSGGGWLRPVDADRLASQYRFGQWIANTDMHYGNASLILSPRRPLTLAPVYDMLPMAYRPDAEGRVSDFDPIHLGPPATDAPERRWARTFWHRLADSEAVSPRFRTLAHQHAISLA